MKYELTQSFYFESAHTLTRRIDAESSKTVHGHTYHAEVSLSGEPDARTGMLVDLGEFRGVLAAVKADIDHRMLNDIPGLAQPTLENLCHYIAESLQGRLPGLSRVSVSRQASGDRCTLRL